jgi:hypothetical protein
VERGLRPNVLPGTLPFSVLNAGAPGKLQGNQEQWRLKKEYPKFAENKKNFKKTYAYKFFSLIFTHSKSYHTVWRANKYFL